MHGSDPVADVIRLQWRTAKILTAILLFVAFIWYYAWCVLTEPYDAKEVVESVESG